MKKQDLETSSQVSHNSKYKRDREEEKFESWRNPQLGQGQP